MRKYGGSRACGMCGNGGAAGLLQGCPLWEVPFAGADAIIGPPSGLVVGRRLCETTRSRPQCRAGVFARRLGFAAAQGFRDDASIVPYEAQGKPLPRVTGYLWGKAAMHPSVCAFRRIHLPLQGRLSTSIACGITASLPASLFRPAGAGRSPIGRPGELLRSEKRRTTRHKPYGAANAAILGRPHLAPGDSQGDRSPLEPCPPPRN